eukprot:2668532-Rhodomonas_salina.1
MMNGALEGCMNARALAIRAHIRLHGESGKRLPEKYLDENYDRYVETHFGDLLLIESAQIAFYRTVEQLAKNVWGVVDMCQDRWKRFL